MTTTRPTPTSSPRIQFLIPGDPPPAPRTKCACRGRYPTVYNPAEYTRWKQQTAERLGSLIPPEQLQDWDPERDVRLSAEFVATPPKTTKLTRPKPDLDNYLKAVQDAITQSGLVWRDDTLVASYGPQTRKRWATPGEPPGIYVTITYEDE